MGVLYSQASFKNSRIAARKPTTSAFTLLVTIAAGIYQKVLDLNPDRTYVTFVNIAPSDKLRYSYGNIGAAIDTDGMPLTVGMGADLESPQELWVKNEGAAAVNLQIDYGQG